MNRDETLSAIHAHYRKLRKLAEKITRTFDMEAIHKFRVEYKKLRAFLRMITTNATDGGKIKMPKSLKKSYGIAGMIRDIQLQQQRIDQAIPVGNKKPKKYHHLLREEIKILRPILIHSFSKHPVSESEAATLSVIPEKIFFDGFPEYATGKWNTVHTLISSAPYSDDHLHMIRKHLKDLFYNMKTDTGDKEGASWPEIFRGKDGANLDQLLNEMGTFQDRRTSVLLLKKNWLKRLPVGEYNLLKGIKTEWLQEKKNLKTLLTEKLKKEFLPN